MVSGLRHDSASPFVVDDVWNGEQLRPSVNLNSSSYHWGCIGSIAMSFWVTPIRLLPLGMSHIDPCFPRRPHSGRDPTSLVRVDLLRR
jgi:hypothetical protein